MWSNSVRPFSFSFLSNRLEFYSCRYVITMCAYSNDFKKLSSPPKGCQCIHFKFAKKKKGPHIHISVPKQTCPVCPLSFYPLPKEYAVLFWLCCPFTPKSTNAQWFSKCCQIRVFPFYWRDFIRFFRTSQWLTVPVFFCCSYPWPSTSSGRTSIHRPPVPASRLWSAKMWRRKYPRWPTLRCQP